MQLSALLEDIFVVPPKADKQILGLALDSREVKNNYLFIAHQGVHLDGRKYIDSAIRNGACAVVQDAAGDQPDIHWHNQTPIFLVPQLKVRLGQIAGQFFQHPEKKMRIFGVTGTNGKTSCSHFLAQALQALHMPCGIIGTLGSGFYGALQPGQLTTPDIISLYAHFQQFVMHQAGAVAMEVSSHAIDQNRIQNIPFEIGIFTNLTRDHLDYHGDMDTYAAVKKSFLVQPLTERVIVNADDAYARLWLAELATRKPVAAYSLSKSSSLPKEVLGIHVDQIDFHEYGMSATVFSPWGEGQLSLPLIGEFNLSNALAVYTALCWLGFAHDQVLAQLARLEPVSGRMQRFGGGANPVVIVDYAHTPDALGKVLKTMRAHCSGRLLCLFGCGGDRDRGKRPEMAKVVEQFADSSVITNDNPRGEVPEQIAQDILKGFALPKKVMVQLDRAKAIQDIIQSAASNDWILIAGKGAETYQQIGDQKLPFSDIEQVKIWLK